MGGFTDVSRKVTFTERHCNGNGVVFRGSVCADNGELTAVVPEYVKCTHANADVLR